MGWTYHNPLLPHLFQTVGRVKDQITHYGRTTNKPVFIDRDVNPANRVFPPNPI